MAAARAAGAALAEETGSSVEYQAVHDAAGVYSHTEAVPDVGYEPVLRAEESLRPSGMPSQLQHAAECMAVRREQTVAMVELAQVTRRATLASRTSVRSMGTKAKRGKRGGRRG
jgi:hypothetical protein